MNGYIAFLKKELMENMKNHRFFILAAVFLIFGSMSAFLARFTPEILSALAADMEMTAPWTHGNNFIKTSPALVSAHVSSCSEAACQMNIPKGH